jgi:hypothetical protein
MTILVVLVLFIVLCVALSGLICDVPMLGIEIYIRSFWRFQVFYVTLSGFDQSYSLIWLTLICCIQQYFSLDVRLGVGRSPQARRVLRGCVLC